MSNEKRIETLTKENDDLKQIIADLQIKLENRSKSHNRKGQVLAILKENGRMTIQEIADGLSISTKNVSSQLTYLRTDGYEIFTDNNGKKFINENK